MNIVHKKPADWTNDDIAAFWDWQSKNAGILQQYFTAAMAPAIVAYLKKNGLLKGEVLDYGCGAGHLLQQMAKEQSADFFGLDFSADSIEETKSKTAGNKNIKELVLVETLPSTFNNDQFDLITLIETIEHLQDATLHETMQELQRILKPGGSIFITTPFNENLEAHFTFCPFCKSEFHHMQHMQSFNIESLTALGLKYGFKVEVCKNLDMQKLRLGTVKHFAKQILVKMAIAAGLKDAVKNKTPNLIALFVKP